MSLKLRTNAKLNLFLRVAGRRPDGYHELESVFHGISLGDDLTLDPTDSGSVEVELTIDESLRGEAPELEDNLAYKAANLIVARGIPFDGLRVTIHKRIPIGAGLGGGSGNAAGVLVGLNDLWKLEHDRDGLIELGATLGSDVPYCISGGTVLAMSRGEVMTPLPVPHEMTFVLGISFDPIATTTVYDRFDELDHDPEPPRSAGMVLALGSGDVVDVATLLFNDLEAAAFDLRPELAAKKETLVAAGALGAGMSGSGPTLFGIASDEAHAEHIASRIRGVFDLVRVVRSTPSCVEVLAEV